MQRIASKSNSLFVHALSLSNEVLLSGVPSFEAEGAPAATSQVFEESAMVWVRMLDRCERFKKGHGSGLDLIEICIQPSRQH